MRRFIHVVAMAVTLGSMGCAASGSGGPGANTYQHGLGLATANDLNREARFVLERRGFEIEEESQSGEYISFVTGWTGRYPLPDEIERGIEQGMSRISIRARASRRRPGLYSVEFMAETRVRLAEDLSWRRDIMTDGLRDYFKEIATELETEFRQSVRIF